MLIVCGTAVIDEQISIENAVIPILGTEGSIWGIKLFFCAYSGHRDTRFELLSATVYPHDFLLWYKNLPVENALRLTSNLSKAHETRESL